MKKIHIIYMAAGNSRRFGKNKLLTEYMGKPLYRHGLDTLVRLVEGTDMTLTVVTQYEEILDYAKDYAVFSPESVNGASFTIKNGINYALSKYGQCDYLMFMVADQPLISEASIKKLISVVNSEADEKTDNNSDIDSYEKTFALSCGNRRGNPCLFHASLIPELLALKDDEGGSVVMKKNKPLLVPIENEKELNDIDTVLDMAN